MFREISKNLKMMEISIRSANVTDIDTLLEFEKGIIDAERPFDGTLKSGEIHYYDLVELINSPKAEVVIAVAGSEIVGSGYAKTLPAKPYQKFKEYAYLGFMYVKQSFRGQGVNQSIVQELIQWSKKNGMTEIRLEVYSENIIAQKAYSKIGFKPNMLEMRLDSAN
jgi:ribosomal protein S18 acetylase RimI-like enzyme